MLEWNFFTAASNSYYRALNVEIHFIFFFLLIVKLHFIAFDWFVSGRFLKTWDVAIRKNSSTGGCWAQSKLISWRRDFSKLSQIIRLLLRGRALYWFEVCWVLPHNTVQLVISIQIDFDVSWCWRLDVHILKVVDVW